MWGREMLVTAHRSGDHYTARSICRIWSNKLKDASCKKIRRQMRARLWQLMTIVKEAGYCVNLLFSSLMLLIQYVISSWWNRAPGSALLSSFIAFFITCCCVASSPTDVTLPNRISSWSSFILQNSYFYWPGWITCRNIVNKVYKCSSSYHYLKCCS